MYGIVFTGLFAGYFYPLSTSAVVFLCFYATINFYVWTLAFAFAPLGTDEGCVTSCIIQYVVLILLLFVIIICYLLLQQVANYST